MKIEVGMIARTNKGLLIDIIHDFDSELCAYKRDEITKASFNIIDLIEVGDIVKMIVLSDNLDLKKGTPITNEVKDITHLQKLNDDKDIEIKSILTKELYEANCYKVVE